ncbi:SA1362 family protein [Niallia oryzisoli]|uniref:SA1362 family protein n=1 Tax=Niallia oryzisoli TaxID=1737571 RepID=UPI0037355AF6
MAFLKNRISFSIVVGLIILAVIGVASKLFTNPAGFFQGIAVMLVIGAVIFFLIRRFYKPSPAKREQRAFVKAAKRSVKRLNQKEPSQPKKKQNNLTSIKKLRARKNQSNPQLTVIEGKKGKKKNRASFF